MNHHIYKYARKLTCSKFMILRRAINGRWAMALSTTLSPKHKAKFYWLLWMRLRLSALFSVVISLHLTVCSTLFMIHFWQQSQHTHKIHTFGGELRKNFILLLLFVNWLLAFIARVYYIDSNVQLSVYTFVVPDDQ